MADRKTAKIKPIPFKGSSMTAIEKALIPYGQFSMIQNMRNRYPGFEQRNGFARKHTTVITDTPKILSLHQFVKGKRTERHFYAQASDDDIYKATDNPPTVTAGVFGTTVFTGTATSIPAAWSNIEELCLFSNGTNQHQINAGTTNYIESFIEYDSDGAPPVVPEDGIDNTQEVTDGDSETSATITTLDVYDNDECLYFRAPIPINRLTFAFISGQVNDTEAVGTLKYRQNDDTWEDTEEVDGTVVTDSGKTMSQDGSMTWSQPGDEIPHYMFGKTGFWYEWQTSIKLDTVKISSITYGTDGTVAKTFESIVNVWNGWPPYAIEARFQQDTGTAFEIYGTDTIDISSMTTNGKVYFNSYDPIIAAYIDPGETPNTTASTTIDLVYGWTGAGFTSLGTPTDGTAGISRAGWVNWKRNTSIQLSQFQTSRYYSYWYYFEVDKTLSSDVIISIETMPYFDINEAGRKGYVNAAWKGRACYNFGDQYGFISAKNKPMVLNGDDFGIIEAGDGRSNRWTCSKQFHNELLVWQEEKGKEGGCLTLFEGTLPKNFGKLLLSSRLGCVNAKSAVVVDGVLTSTRTDEVVKTLAFWISRYGACVTDGRTCAIFSDDIANYFDPLKTECIRRGYENEHWLDHDSSDNVLRFGLVSGIAIMTGTATSTEASKLNDTAGAFTTRKSVTGHPINHTITVGDTVYNITDSTETLITAVGATQLTLASNIMAKDDVYVIYAGTPNLFPVFDLVDKTWSFDGFPTNFSCMTEVEAASGKVPVLQYGGAVDDGYIYRLNTGMDDIHGATPTTVGVDANAFLQLNANGLWVYLRELLLMMKAQIAGNCTITPYRNNIAGTAIDVSMIAKTSGDAAVQHRMGIGAGSINIGIKFQNNTDGESLYLLTWGAEVYEKEGH